MRQTWCGDGDILRMAPRSATPVGERVQYSAMEKEYACRSESAEQTKEIGAALGALLRAGDVVLLSGDLGAGKTQFTQGVARAMNIPEDQVTSPTFNILLTYEGRVGGEPLVLNHFDLYRLDTSEQLVDIDFAGVLESGGACLIEWADKFPAAMPEDRLEVEITADADGVRTIRACAKGSRAQAVLEAWEGGQSSVASDTRTALPGEPGESAGEVNPGVVSPSTPDARENDGARDVVLAFDTSNEVIAIGLGRLDAQTRTVEPIATRELPAHRASNTKLLPTIDALLREVGIGRGRIACVACGRGPGSFTGVRICMATAKGVAMALEVGLYGVSTPDAVAWGLWHAGVRGEAAVVADAMRKEVYPVRYSIDEVGIARRNADVVMKAAEGVPFVGSPDILAGDGLVKYRDLYEQAAPLAPETQWTPTGMGLLLALQAQWRGGTVDPFDAAAGNPAFALPVYTRLSDAEENERIRLADTAPRDLKTGVQHVAEARPAIVYRPLDAAHAADVARMEHELMGTDAWSESLVLDELPRADRVWWEALDRDGKLVGYAGALVVEGDMQILKIGTARDHQREGIATQLLAHVAEDARALGAEKASLEVRVGNVGAIRFYENLGFENLGRRPRYYSDREDAFILQGPLPLGDRAHTVGGMEIRHLEAASAKPDMPAKTLLLAFESSCDETAAAVVDERGTLHSDVVASQIDFHSRFGGVVPEIASRKHIEAICGVAQEGLDAAAASLGVPRLRFRDLDAVAATYAPGLVGALVVGVAFAKGAAWGADIPFIGVNHLEGHLYANKIATPDIEPPMVVSLVSGGHTMLVHVRAWGDYETLGSTIDDAVGEAFDKVAKALGLGYPGGPIISKLAKDGNPKAVRFPRAMMHSGDLRFSLSGLKTAVITYIQKERAAGNDLCLPDIAASFQQAVIDVQVAKARTALRDTGAREFCLGGGVAANPALRAAYEQMCRQEGVRLTMPPLSSCTDNAGMISLVALERYNRGAFFGLDADVKAHAPLDEAY